MEVQRRDGHLRRWCDAPRACPTLLLLLPQWATRSSCTCSEEPHTIQLLLTCVRCIPPALSLPRPSAPAIGLSVFFINGTLPPSLSQLLSLLIDRFLMTVVLYESLSKLICAVQLLGHHSLCLVCARARTLSSLLHSHRVLLL